MRVFFLFFFLVGSFLEAKVLIGLDRIFEPEFVHHFRNKKIGIVTNQTAINQSYDTILDLFFEKKDLCKIAALFAPEHGIDGLFLASHKINDDMKYKIPVHSLFGLTRRPTKEMLANIDLLVFDIQDIGCRSYTYATTLFYCIEECAKHHVPLVVLDRPNPMGGNLVDGFFVDPLFRSFISYINVPFCHGMTIGELARYFNEEYNIKSSLTVIPMKGWTRDMTFSDTKLPWIPTSPNIPEKDTPFYYATTAALGELSFVNIGVGYTLPFKVIGAPWIDADAFHAALKKQNLPGVTFTKVHFRPFFGLFKGESCHGVQLHVTDPATYQPVKVQSFLLGILKSLYPKEIATALQKAEGKKQQIFSQAVGTDYIIKLLKQEKHVSWKLAEYQTQKRRDFIQTRKKYLLY